MRDTDASRDELAVEILRYLARHRDASDTALGIAQWWLLREWAERRVDDVQRALLVLEASGLVLKRSQPGQEPRYGMNPAKGKEIETLIRRDGASGSNPGLPTEPPS